MIGRLIKRTRWYCDQVRRDRVAWIRWCFEVERVPQPTPGLEELSMRGLVGRERERRALAVVLSDRPWSP